MNNQNPIKILNDKKTKSKNIPHDTKTNPKNPEQLELFLEINKDHNIAAYLYSRYPRRSPQRT